MATNPELKAALLKKLGVTPQRLSQLVNRRKTELPMSTTQAVYTIAHENGIDVSKYLDSEETREVRDLVASLKASGAKSAPENGGTLRQAGSTQKPKPVQVTIAGLNIDKLNLPGLSAKHAREAKEMATVYTTLYLFENSVRDVIERVLRAAHGDDWWTMQVPGRVQETAKKHEADERKDPWHGRRGTREIDYVYLTDLWAIIKHRWPDFSHLFPQGQAWVQSLLENDMNVSRRVVAHMNPLAKDDIKNVETSFRKWTAHLKGVRDQLP